MAVATNLGKVLAAGTVICGTLSIAQIFRLDGYKANFFKQSISSLIARTGFVKSYQKPGKTEAIAEEDNHILYVICNEVLSGFFFEL